MFCGPVKSWAWGRKQRPQAHGKREKTIKIESSWACGDKTAATGPREERKGKQDKGIVGLRKKKIGAGPREE